MGNKTPEPKKPQVQRVRSEMKTNKTTKKKPSNEISPKKRSLKKSKNMNESVLNIKENSFLKKDFSTVSKDLKIKKGKKSQENLKYDEKIRKIDIKQYLADLNKVTRVDNLKKFKHEKFKPKCVWGLDERRLAAGSCSKNFRDFDIARKKFRNEKDRSKSAEKSRIELPKVSDEEKKCLKKKKIEAKKGKIIVNRSKDLHRDEAFKRGKEQNFKKSPKRVKSAKVSKKKIVKKVDTSYEEVQRNAWNDEDPFDSLKVVRSKTPDRIESSGFVYNNHGRENFFFGKEESEEKGVMHTDCNYKSEETVQPTSATLKLTEGKDSYSIIQPDDDFKELPSLDISKRKEEIKKKLNDLRVKVEKNVESHSIDEEHQHKSATKIQAHIRGWLTRQALSRYIQSLYKSESWVSFHEEDSLQSSSKSIETQKSLQILSKVSSNFDSSEVSSIVQLQRDPVQIDASLVLKTESHWRELQKEKLVHLKNKDFEDIQKIAKHFGSEDFLLPFFEKLIERRYANIDQIFDEHLEAVKGIVQFASEDKPKSILNSVDDVRGSRESIQEPPAEVDFEQLKFYSENEEASLRISEIDLASDKPGVSSRTVEEIRASVELDLKKVIFFKAENKNLPPRTCSEPGFPLFDSEALEICEVIVVHEVFLESLEFARRDLEVEEAINAANIILNEMIEEEVKNYQKEIKENHKLNTCQSTLHLTPLPLVEYLPLDDRFIENFIKSLLEFFYLQEFDLDRVLNVPNCYSCLELLTKMQESDIGVLIDKKPNKFPLIQNLYNDFCTWQNLTGLKLVHSRLLFDCTNEFLMKKSVKPQPFPWSDRKKTRLSQEILSHIGVLPALIFELKHLNKLRAGKVPIIEMINSRDSEGEIISQMREDHLSCILAVEVISQEPEWIDYEFEETQVKLDLSDMVLEELVEETIEILNAI
jgi:hypothetical protein